MRAAARASRERRPRPLVLVGGSRWDGDACSALTEFAARHALPVACAFRRQDLFDNRHASYVGDVGIAINPALAARIREADVLIVVIGERLGEMTTSGYTLLSVPLPTQTLIHVHPGVEELGRVYRPAVAIAATPAAFPGSNRKTSRRSRRTRWRASTAAARADYDAWRAPRPAPGAHGSLAGRPAGWTSGFPTTRSSPTGPATTRRGCTASTAIAGPGHAARTLRRPRWATAFPLRLPRSSCTRSRIVVSWNGDGCFLMNGQELATAVQYGAGVVFVVIDNGMYGTIRMHQERRYPGSVVGSGLANPDFAALARAFGAHGETVRRTGEFAPAFERALDAKRPALLHVLLDPQALTMNATLDSIRSTGERR